MKKLLLVFTMLICANAFAQYKSLFTDSTQYWKYYNYESNSMKTSEFTDSVYVDGIVQFNGLTYYKLNSTYNVSIGVFTYGYIREDTTIGKAWFLRDTTPNTFYENLIYDLSLNIGDSVSVRSIFGNVEYLVADSIYYLNGRKIIRTGLIGTATYSIEFPLSNIADSYQNIYFIEGIGNTKLFELALFGPIQPFVVLANSEVLLCAYQNNQQVYLHNLNTKYSFLMGCDYYNNSTKIIENNAKTNLEVFPNPVHETLSIRISTLQLRSAQQNLSIQVFDLLGKEQKISWQKESDAILKVNTASLPQGVYLVRVKTSEGVVSKKIVKN